MKISRRRFLALGVGAVGSGIILSVIRDRGIMSHSINVIREVYGSEIADHEAAYEFARAYQSFVVEKGISGRLLDFIYRCGLQNLPYVKDRLNSIDDSVINKFAMSTNAIIAIERGAPLVFVALFSPYHAPCTNQLGAFANI